MKATVFDEPKLDFGHGGSHEDPRAGITDYGPVDLGDTGRSDTESASVLSAWPKESQVLVAGSNDAARRSRRRRTTGTRACSGDSPDSMPTAVSALSWCSTTPG